MSIQVPLYARDGTVRAWSIIDDEDAHLAAYRWCLHHAGYAKRQAPNGNGQKRTVLLHRAILGLVQDDGREGDHIDGDRLNNRRANLRAVTHAENSQNRASQPGTSRYRGVSWSEWTHSWQVQVAVNGRVFYLGRFADEDEAARVASEGRLLLMPFTNEDRMIAA